MKKHILTLTLAVTFLVACSVQADMIKFSFNWTDNGGSLEQNNTHKQEEWDSYNDLVSGMSLTAANIENGNGIEFVFSSDTFVTIQGPNGNSADSQFFFFTNNDPSSVHYFDTSPDYVNTQNNNFLIWKPVDFLVQQPMDKDSESPWTWTFALNYADGYDWASFLALVNDSGFGFGAHITGEFFSTSGGSGGQGLRIYTDGFTTHDAIVPAPATLAVVALGLAGLGYVRTRRKK